MGAFCVLPVKDQLNPVFLRFPLNSSDLSVTMQSFSEHQLHNLDTVLLLNSRWVCNILLGGNHHDHVKDETARNCFD